MDGHTWTSHQKTALQSMRPYEPGEDLNHVDCSRAPKVGDWIAASSTDPDDQWLITAEFYNDNYTQA